MPLCPVHAAGTEEARDELNDTLEALKESGRRQRQLVDKASKLKHEMAALQEDMVSLARDVEKKGEQLTSTQEKLAILEDQEKEKSRALEKRRSELSAMISAMIRLRQLPPEAVIAMPGKLEETVRTARALGLVTHAIEEEAKSLKEQLNELEELAAKIRKSRETLLERKSALETRQKELNGKLRERDRISVTLGGREREEKLRQQQLTAKSQNLQDLVDTLEKNERREKESPPTWKRSSKAVKKKLRSFDDQRGDLQRPSGRVVSRYGASTAGAEFSKGMVIETRSEANVLAPFDGEVVFAGNFRDYGRMVILRHAGGYHTLLSGMENLHCELGQFLLEGEPIGAMGKRASEHRLYLELRKDGRPIDPAPWFRG